MNTVFDFNKKLGSQRIKEFAQLMLQISRMIGFKVSSRGWCYIMEGKRYINKDQFDKVEDAINRCRKSGLLPVDFVAEEGARAFSGVEKPSVEEGHTLKDCLRWALETAATGHRWYTPDWWEGEEYYIQMVVEKVDLVTLFEPVCRKYHIPIANSKGWSSISQRAEYSRRFKEAEDKGLKCVLLYCGDHDPDGLRISETLRKNLHDVKDITWADGEEGYDPADLIIDRFGLNYEYIIANDFTWIDNLISGSGKDLGDPKHKNAGMPYLKEYLNTVGRRKCEANVLVVLPSAARDLCAEAINRYVDEEALDRFRQKTSDTVDRYDAMLEKFDVMEDIQAILYKISDQDE